MHRVIYADVLVVINVYITFFLLKSAGLLAREESDRLRLFIASLLGGIYSLSVLLPEKVQLLLFAVRLFLMLLLVFVGFGYKSLKGFLRLNICFLISSFIFAGLMFALWYFVCPQGMYFNGTVVYFDIDILTLALLTVVCYAVLKLFERFFRSRAPVNTVFICRLLYDGEEYQLKAFLDTGNRLTDYFTLSPVIIADKRIFQREVNEALGNTEKFKEKGLRYIFCDTLGGEGLLPAFSAEKVHIKGTDYDFTAASVTVALTDKKLLGGEYDAILPMGLFENLYERKVEAENEKNNVTP